MKTIIRIAIDPEVPEGSVMTGGARIVTPKDDQDLGRELRTQVVRVNNATDAAALRVDLAHWHHDDIEIEGPWNPRSS